jgi:hypothetical protein
VRRRGEGGEEGEGEAFLSRGTARGRKTGGVRVLRADARQRRAVCPRWLSRGAEWRCCPCLPRTDGRSVALARCTGGVG